MNDDMNSRVEKYSRDISEMLESTDQPEITPSPCCIYRTPDVLRKANEAAYMPRLVAIGPYHCMNKEWTRLDDVKRRYLRSYLARTQRTLKDILRYILECEEELKSYYADSTNVHVEMMLLDGVFIIELFLRMFYTDLVQSSDEILPQSTDLISDLFFMQENQLPWFFIEELYNKDVIQPQPHRIPFLDLALSICSSTVPSYSLDIGVIRKLGVKRFHNRDMIRRLGVKHLHDLLRTAIIHPLPSRAYCLPSTQQRLSATVLYEAGVKFKVRKSKPFLDIIFDKGALYMPSFIFDRDTETFARNLMAYEQCLYPDGIGPTYLCDYFYLMDSLINTSKDVDLLVKSRIIINWLGENDEVATLVNNLTKNIQIDAYRFSYAELCFDLYMHCNFSWKARLNRDYLSTLKRDYLSTPWKVASTIAAIILLLLTLIQTVCSLVSLFK